MTEKQIKEFIKEEVQKMTIQKVVKTYTPGEVVILNVEVGDMPKEDVYNLCKSLKEICCEQGLDNIIIAPTQEGKNRVTATTVKQEISYELK